MTYELQDPTSHLRPWIERMLPSDEGSIYVFEVGARVLAQVPTSLLGYGAISACFRLSTEQADNFVRRAGRASMELKQDDTEFAGVNLKHLLHDTPMVLKVLCPRSDVFATGEQKRDVVARFLREGKFGLRLPSHPHIASIVAVGPLNVELSKWVLVPTWAILEEYGGARTLSDVMRRPRLRLAKRLQFARELCSAVAHLHKHGLLHRDIKPANILVGDGALKLADIGTAKALVLPDKRAVSSLTRTGQHGLGTFKYMAPEQIRDSKRVGRAADIFALSITITELLWGSLFPDRDSVLAIAALTQRGPVSYGTFVSHMPSPLEYVDSPFRRGNGALARGIIEAVQKGFNWRASRRPNAKQTEKALSRLVPDAD